MSWRRLWPWGVLAAGLLVAALLAALLVPRLLHPSTPLHRVAAGGDVVPVPDGWPAAAVPAGSDVTLLARPPDGEGEETVRRGPVTQPISDAVSSYKMLFRFERPKGRILISRAIKLSGASQAWLLRTSYDSRIQDKPVHLWEIDVFAHSSQGEDLHLVLVSTSQGPVEGALEGMSQLQLGHPVAQASR